MNEPTITESAPSFPITYRAGREAATREERAQMDSQMFESLQAGRFFTDGNGALGGSVAPGANETVSTAVHRAVKENGMTEDDYRKMYCGVVQDVLRDNPGLDKDQLKKLAKERSTIYGVAQQIYGDDPEADDKLANLQGTLFNTLHDLRQNKYGEHVDAWLQQQQSLDVLLDNDDLREALPEFSYEKANVVRGEDGKWKLNREAVYLLNERFKGEDKRRYLESNPNAQLYLDENGELILDGEGTADTEKAFPFMSGYGMMPAGVSSDNGLKQRGFIEWYKDDRSGSSHKAILANQQTNLNKLVLLTLNLRLARFREENGGPHFGKECEIVRDVMDPAKLPQYLQELKDHNMSYLDALQARNTEAADRSYEENHKFWRERLKRAQADGETAKAKDEAALAAQQEREKTYTRPKSHQCAIIKDPSNPDKPRVYTSPEEFKDICLAHHVDPARASITVLFPGGLHGEDEIPVVSTEKLARGENAALPRYYLNTAAAVHTYGAKAIFDFDKKHGSISRKEAKQWHNYSNEMSFSVKQR